MTKAQSWTMAALGALALVIGVIMAGMAATSAQEGTPTPTPTQSEEDDGETPSEDDDGDADRACPGGGKHLVFDDAAEILGMTEDELREALASGQTLAEVAQAQGMDMEAFEASLVAAVTADLQAELDAGDITQEQFDDITAGLADRVDDIVNREGFPGPHGGPGRRVGHLGVFDAAAEVLGITEDELYEAIESGQTLAEVAQAQGMDVEAFKAALVANLTADLQARLDAGEITQEQFDDITADLVENVDDIVNGELGLRFSGGPRVPEPDDGTTSTNFGTGA